LAHTTICFRRTEPAASVAERVKRRVNELGHPRQGRQRTVPLKTRGQLNVLCPDRTEDRTTSEASHCWGRRISFNTSSHKTSGLRSPALARAMSFVAMACLTSSVQSPVRRAMQAISSATLRTRVQFAVKEWGNGHRRAPPRDRRERGRVSQPSAPEFWFYWPMMKTHCV
jgi:hypothetical protein